MKKSFVYYLLLIFILGIPINNNGMTTQTRRLIAKRLPRTTPSTIFYTKTYTNPTMTDRLKHYYVQWKQWIWGPPKSENVMINEARTIVEKIKNKKSDYIEDFDFSIQKEEQKEVNFLLNELIKYPEGLFLLNNYVALTCTTYVKETLKRTGTPKKYGIVLKKISNWAKDNIMQIFLTVPFIDENFFLVPLMYFPKISLPDQKIIQVIHDYLVQIKKTISGEKFLDLLKEEDPELYAIILSDASMTSGIKDVIAEEKNKLITKE